MPGLGVRAKTVIGEGVSEFVIRESVDGNETLSLLHIDDLIQVVTSKRNEFGNVTIEKHSTTESIINRSKDTIIAIIDGSMISNNGSYVLSPGDIVSPETIDRLSDVFSIKTHLSILTVT